ARARPGETGPAGPVPSARCARRSTEHVVRDVREPAVRVFDLATAELGRCAGRAHAAGDRLDHLRPLVVLPELVDVRDRDAVVLADDAVAGVDVRRRAGLLALEQRDDRGGGDLGLRIRRIPRLRHAGRDARVADDVDALVDLRFEGRHVHRTPVTGAGQARVGRDLAGLLRRNQVEHVGLVRVAELRGDRHLAGVDLADAAVGLLAA